MRRRHGTATGKEKGSADALAKLATDKGTGPNTNPYYQEDKKGENYESYDFEDGLKDGSENKRDLKEGKNAEVKENALVLKDGESYVTSPIEELGNGTNCHLTLSWKSRQNRVISYLSLTRHMEHTISELWKMAN